MQMYFRSISAAVCASVSLLASTAMAQSSGSGAPAIGSSTPAEHRGNVSITEQKFAQWSLQCSNDHAMNPPCQIIYQLPTADNKTIAVISMAKAAGGTVGMQVAVPLGFAIQAGVKIAFGPNFAMTAAVSRCTVQGCLIEGVAPANLLTAMMREKTGQISLQMQQGGNIDLPVSLDGFPEAFKAMSAKM